MAGWLVVVHGSTEVVRRAQDEWGISPRTAQRLLAAARADLVRGWNVERHEMIALLLSMLDTVFREAMAAKNHGAALGAINAAAKLAKL
jgi:hypothetical protein